jgi:mono/diheme cytochrome c family protein
MRVTSQRRQRWVWAGAALLPLGLGLLASAAPRPATRPAPAKAAPVAAAPRLPRIEYNRDIRPILAENCFACHGPDSAARKADLRLDRPQDATILRNGRAPIVKGNPAASEVFKRIKGEGPIMPPRSTHKVLTPQQIETMRRWIAEGAEYQAHWSLIAPKRPAVPAVKNRAWARNPIDAFVLARLERAGLTPAAEADRRTLARRVSLDLTGLPPDPAELEAFVADRSPDAYEKYVDLLLAKPEWGEHRGRYWLDAARYADTHGIHFDNFRENYAYRDWVIKALNRNLPFDQFTIEQLAGDLLPKPTLDQMVATGFNRNNITTNEGGAIADEYLVLYNRDRTETTAAVFMGTTAGCAVCHDHKFDPLSQREFYSLAAFFNNTIQNAMDGNIKDTPPVVTVPRDEDRERFEALKTEIPAARRLVEARREGARADFDKWLAGADRAVVNASLPTDGLRLHVPLNEGQGRAVQALVDGRPASLTAGADPVWEAGNVADKAFQRTAGSAVEVPGAGDFEKDQSFTISAWVKLPNANASGAIVARMDEAAMHRGWDLWVEQGKIGMHLVNRWPEDALKVVSRDRLQPGRWQHVTVTYNGAANPGGLMLYINGVVRAQEVQANALKGTIRTGVPFKIGQRHASAGLDGTGIQDVRVYDRALLPEAVARLGRATRAAYLAARPTLTDAEKTELFTWWLPDADPEFRRLNEQLGTLEGEESTIRFRGTIAHVSQEKQEAAMAYLLFRGEYDKRRDPVKPATPDALPPMPEDLPRNRLGFAKWLLLPEHPLTARVTVNRFWQELFGNGLVRTSGDFGIMGELPSHPELLDWLAVEFREGGWDIKKLFKLLVTSATYRQSAQITPEKRLKDRENRLLSRGPRFRMDAEMIRDYALAASGLLVRKLGGPSVKPYQPDGVWEAVAMIGSNTRNYQRDTGENLYRRSMYTFWKRSAPPASLEIFNATNRETCTVRRDRTNTPLQALVTLNDVQFVEAARHLAQRALKEGGAATPQRLDFLARRLLARPFRPAEQAVVAKSLTELEAFYKGHAKEAKDVVTVGESKPDETLDAGQLAAWTMLVNQLMNLDEVLCK